MTNNAIIIKDIQLLYRTFNKFYKSIYALFIQFQFQPIINVMNNFNDREKAFEKKFANDQEAEFKISARRNKLLGAWVADILKYDEEKKKNYVVEIIKADFQEAGDEDVFRKIKKDLEGSNIQDADIRKKMSEFLEAAKQQI